MKIVEVKHPLVKHKLGLMREQDISTKRFRELASEVGSLLTYEATADLETEKVTIEGWNGPVEIDQIKGKKITVVNEVASALNLKNVKGIKERAEKLNERYDFIISRAVTAFPDFVAFTRKLISDKQKNALPNGIIYLKGGDFSEELKPFQKIVEVFNISDYFEEPFFETKKIIYLPL